MSLTSFPEELAAWALTRLAMVRVVLLWLALSLSLQFIAHEFFTAAAITGALLAALLIIQFRLWDDLADRAYDAALHPHRVLVNTPYLRSFRLVCIVLALPVANVLLIHGLDHLLVYAALLAAMSALYAVRANALSRLLRAHLVLLKYPVFIWLCAWNVGEGKWLPFAIGMYLALCLFEIASDAALRTGTSWRWLAAIEISACVALFIF
ncbi:MAG: hypothetical protein PHQ60_13500 [Sideroxydans sp.]|nr:hypothetical protein [Sideroxydans sp.]